MNEGDYLLVETKTLGNTFGTVLYQVQRVGLECPVKGCPHKDGVEFVMILGSGPAASSGRKITDCESVIRQNIKDGKSKIVQKGEGFTFQVGNGDAQSGDVTDVIEELKKQHDVAVKDKVKTPIVYTVG